MKLIQRERHHCIVVGNGKVAWIQRYHERFGRSERSIGNRSFSAGVIIASIWGCKVGLYELALWRYRTRTFNNAWFVVTPKKDMFGENVTSIHQLYVYRGRCVVAILNPMWSRASRPSDAWHLQLATACSHSYFSFLRGLLQIVSLSFSTLQNTHLSSEYVEKHLVKTRELHWEYFYF